MATLPLQSHFSESFSAPIPLLQSHGFEAGLGSEDFCRQPAAILPTAFDLLGLLRRPRIEMKRSRFIELGMPHVQLGSSLASLALSSPGGRPLPPWRPFFELPPAQSVHLSPRKHPCNMPRCLFVAADSGASWAWCSGPGCLEAAHPY